MGSLTFGYFDPIFARFLWGAARSAILPRLSCSALPFSNRSRSVLSLPFSSGVYWSTGGVKMTMQITHSLALQITARASRVHIIGILKFWQFLTVSGGIALNFFHIVIAIFYWCFCRFVVVGAKINCCRSNP